LEIRRWRRRRKWRRRRQEEYEQDKENIYGR